MAAQQYRPEIIVPFTRPVQYESRSFADYYSLRCIVTCSAAALNLNYIPQGFRHGSVVMVPAISSGVDLS